MNSPPSLRGRGSPPAPVNGRPHAGVVLVCRRPAGANQRTTKAKLAFRIEGGETAQDTEDAENGTTKSQRGILNFGLRIMEVFAGRQGGPAVRSDWGLPASLRLCVNPSSLSSPVTPAVGQEGLSLSAPPPRGGRLLSHGRQPVVTGNTKANPKPPQGGDRFNEKNRIKEIC